jgi:hypothetical protein
MYCLVGMHDLRAAPFSLTYDTLVRAKVLARKYVARFEGPTFAELMRKVTPTSKPFEDQLRRHTGNNVGI